MGACPAMKIQVFHLVAGLLCLQAIERGKIKFIFRHWMAKKNGASPVTITIISSQNGQAICKSIRVDYEIKELSFYDQKCFE